MPKMAAYERVVLSTYLSKPRSVNGRNEILHVEKAHIEEITDAQQRQNSHV